MAAAAAAMAEMEMPAPGNPIALRAFVDPILQGTFAGLPDNVHIETVSFEIEVSGGSIPLRLYRAPEAEPGPVILYVHGGGMISGSIDIYDRLIREYVSLTGAAFLAVGYRLAPEYSDVGLAYDVLAALRWLSGIAAGLGLDPARIALMGDSGGGGIAAATAIMARNEGLSVAKQILVYPMLDDTTVDPDPLIAPFARWTYDFNRTAWHAVLSNPVTQATAAPLVPPTRLSDLSGLPPTYIEVGELDIFRDECVSYAQKLMHAGVSCELHILAGCPHLFEGADWASTVSTEALGRRAAAIKGIYK